MGTYTLKIQTQSETTIQMTDDFERRIVSDITNTWHHINLDQALLETERYLREPPNKHVAQVILSLEEPPF